MTPEEISRLINEDAVEGIRIVQYINEVHELRLRDIWHLFDDAIKTPNAHVGYVYEKDIQVLERGGSLEPEEVEGLHDVDVFEAETGAIESVVLYEAPKEASREELARAYYYEAYERYED